MNPFPPNPNPDVPANGQSTFSVARPPIACLVVAGVIALVGLALAAIPTDSVVFAAVGWVLAGPVAIGMVSAFTLIDTKRRSMPVYTHPSWIKAAYIAVMTVAGAGIIVAALRIADWVGRHWT